MLLWLTSTVILPAAPQVVSGADPLPTRENCEIRAQPIRPSVVASSRSVGPALQFFLSTGTSSLQTTRFESISVSATTGAPTESLWKANGDVRAAEQRQIITSSPEGHAIPLRHTHSRNAISVTRGFLDEHSAAPTISSKPIFVGPPSFRYRSTMESKPYADFAETFKNRDAFVYSGTTTGAVRAFNAATGMEAFAYIPSRVSTANDPASAPYLVKGSPAMGDAYFGGSWHTVLAAGMNSGGRAIYALDITNPGLFSAAESHARDLVMWEFTEANNPDLGLTYSQPTVARLHNGKWAVIFGNGYVNRANSTSIGTIGRAVLFIVAVEDGKLIRKLAPTHLDERDEPFVNGLSTPAVVDYDRDGVADYVYAGDLLGNVWKFDLTDIESEKWHIAFNGRPLFRARGSNAEPQAITTRPEVSRDPDGAGMVILFGAGSPKDLGCQSNGPGSSYSFYGIEDRGADTVPDRRSLLRQQIVSQLTIERNRRTMRLRTTTSDGSTNNMGWYLDFDPAEQLTEGPVLRAGLLLLSTVLINGNVCTTSACEHWLMALNPLNGSAPRLDEPVFDVNDDGKFGTEDTARINPRNPAQRSSITGVSFSPAGIASGVEIVEQVDNPAGCIRRLYFPRSDGDLDFVSMSCRHSAPGRQSWRKLL